MTYGIKRTSTPKAINKPGKPCRLKNLKHPNIIDNTRAKNSASNQGQALTKLNEVNIDSRAKAVVNPNQANNKALIMSDLLDLTQARIIMARNAGIRK